MTDHAPRPTRLADYRPPAWLIDDVHLTFRLDEKATRVISRIAFRPNPDSESREFRLDGEKLDLVSAMIDGVPVHARVDETGLTAPVPDGPFVWEAEVEIDPSANTELEGLYRSNGLFCTQCEAEGFRKITFYPDRPDVLAPFTVRIEGEGPVLLSNGNLVAEGEGWAEWHDPWPKPSYLFALVAGEFVARSDSYRTAEGRDVALNVWVRPGDEDRTAYALDALKRSFAWDEKVYGRSYDLDVFNLVAVDDFNAGAMENKGLNIFNSSYVLASAETATDMDYEWIESVVAHEYFHNWTGNRITCRDWFQLSLKEGLTVFRDQQFTADMRSAPVKRIADALKLRARQFREDAGPLAHPVRPEEYIEINNFYTSTVYDKGAEVIGMLKTLVGDEAYDKALDLYFERHDGQACTVEDWLRVFEDTTGRDLSQFKLWYSQAGTPRVKIAVETDGNGWKVTARQEVPPTPGQPDKAPMVLPVRLALFGQDGAPLGDEETVVLDTAEAVLARGEGERPIVSAFRGFSAPVRVEQDLTAAERLVLLAHDTDPFNRWEAGRVLAKEQLTAMIVGGATPDGAYLDALGRVVTDEALDPAFRAFALGLPSEDDLAQSIFDAGGTPDPTLIHARREDLVRAIAEAHVEVFAGLYDDLSSDEPYAPDAEGAGRRALRLAALSMLTRVDGVGRAKALYAEADNMTERLGAFGALLRAGEAEAEVAAFHDRWKHNTNVMDKWFGMQVGQAAPDRAVGVARALTEHPLFDWKRPNRFRSVIGALAGNTAGFHDPSGAGYAFVADWLKRLDKINPVSAARMAPVFETLARYDGDRQGMMRDALAHLLSGEPSRNLAEVASRILDSAER